MRTIALESRDKEARERDEAYNTKAAAPAGYAHLGKAVEEREWAAQAVSHTAGPVPTGSPLTECLHLGNIEDAMTYQAWGPLETSAGEQVKEALTLAAKTILRVVPDGAFRSVALRNVIEARMNANAAISFRGRF